MFLERTETLDSVCVVWNKTFYWGEIGLFVNNILNISFLCLRDLLSVILFFLTKVWIPCEWIIDCCWVESILVPLELQDGDRSFVLTSACNCDCCTSETTCGLYWIQDRFVMPIRWNHLVSRLQWNDTPVVQLYNVCVTQRHSSVYFSFFIKRERSMETVWFILYLLMGHLDCHHVQYYNITQYYNIAQHCTTEYQLSGLFSFRFFFSARQFFLKLLYW